MIYVNLYDKILVNFMFNVIFLAKFFSLSLLKFKSFTIGSEILGPLIGAIIGSISAWILAYVPEKYKFIKRKKAVSAILYSENSTNVMNLKKYDIYYPLINRADLFDKGVIKNINDFYKDLNDFPNITHDNWDKFIDFIPDIFNEDEIDKIISFNSDMDKLRKQAERLSENPLYIDEEDKYSKLKDIKFSRYAEITKHYEMFKKNFTELLEDSNNIQDIFREKRFKTIDWKYLVLFFVFLYVGLFCFLVFLEFLIITT